MNQKTVAFIQQRILKLVPNEQGILLNDSCSEVVRLVSGWLKKDIKSEQFFVLKGENILESTKSHDLLLIKSNKKILIIDPTVWQFFPKSKTILVYSGDSKKEGVGKVAKTYGGKWDISEEIIGISSEEEKAYLDIINRNIQENQK